MIVLSGALVLVALVLLVFGAVDRNLPYVYASIGVSVLSLLLLLVGILQRRGELPGEGEGGATTPVTDTSAERVPALVAAGPEQTPAAGTDRQEVTAPPPAPAHVDADGPERPASRRVAPQAQPDEPVGDDEDDAAGYEDELAEDEAADGELAEDELAEDELAEDELAEDELAEDEADEDSGVTVLVVSGRPRYHLEGCRVLRGKEPQPLDRDEARGHGFSPCGVCKPDSDDTVPQAGVAAGASAQEGGSSTEALFGEPLFADGPAAEREAPEQPERLVQPAPQARDVEPPPPLRGDDPADDPDAGMPVAAAGPHEPAVASEADDEQPAQTDDDVLADQVPADPAVDEPVDDEPVDDEPVVEPVAGDEVPVAPAGPTDDEPLVAAVDPEEPAPGRRTGMGAPAGPAQVDSVAAHDDDAVAPDSGEPASDPALTGTASAGTAPAAEAPRAPAKKAPAKKAPAKKVPAKKAPAKRVPAKKSPAKTAPAEQAQAAAAPEPQVKRPMVRTVRADALHLGAPSAGVTTTRVSARAAAPAAGASVVVVPERDRFHRAECRFVRGVAGATTLPKASAARQGYAACGVCKP